MVLHGVTLVSLTEALRDVDPTLLSLFYSVDTSFDGSEHRSAAQLRLLMDSRPDQGYLPDPYKSIFIVENLEEKEAANRYFDRVGLNLNYVYGGCYMGAYLGTREELE